MPGKTGALFTSFTTTKKVLVSLKGGEPPSVTRTVIMFVLGPWASVGVHVKMPLVAFTLAPEGAAGSRLKVRESPFGSVALFVNIREAPSLIVLFEIAAS